MRFLNPDELVVDGGELASLALRVILKVILGAFLLQNRGGLPLGTHAAFLIIILQVHVVQIVLPAQ